MANFLNQNKGKLSLILIIVCLCLGWIDSQIEKETSNLIQWLLFFACIIGLLKINFSHFYEEVEYEDELIENKKNPNMETNTNQADKFGPKTKEAPKTQESQKEDDVTPAAKTASDMPKVEGIKGFSLHNIHKKWRPMYQDICAFALHAVQNEHEVDAKVQKWGLKYQKARAGSNLIAYVIEHGWGNQRIPEAGFFEVK